MSIWDDSGSLVFDTGDAVSMLSQNYGEYLNPYTASRNDDKGAEPEGVTTGVYAERTWAFLGLERAGGVMIWDVTEAGNAHFDQYLTFSEHVSPEGLTFVPGHDSPTNQPLLLVANEVSGTIAIASPVHQSDDAMSFDDDDDDCEPLDTGDHLAASCDDQLVVMGDSNVFWEMTGEYDSGLGEGASEVPVYDALSGRAFVVNAVEGSVDILDMSLPHHPNLIHRIGVSNGEPNSVAVHDGLVAIAVAGDGAEGSGMSKQDPGYVVFTDADGQYITSVNAGALPDMLTFTPNGDAVLVANEGEPNGDYTIDPEGTVSYIDLSGGVSSLAQSDVTSINFHAFEASAASLAQEGVRIFGPNANVSEDLEPEYIAISGDGLTAMVVLQENNALAEIDLTTKTVTDIHAMGYKDYSLGEYDFSDRDGGVNFVTTDKVWGMYQPDAITSFEIDGVTYYMTANEGDARDYDGYSEEVRADDLTLNTTAFPNGVQDEDLGRLKTTTANDCGDLDGDGAVDVICSYGARSATIWTIDANGALVMVWDSNDAFDHLATSQGEYINSYTASRNDDKSIEPEGVTIGHAFGKTYAFVCLERAGGIMVYDVSEPTAPEFVQYIYLHEHVSPEAMAFVSSADSPNGLAMLIVAHEVSGTVVVLQPTFV